MRAKNVRYVAFLFVVLLAAGMTGCDTFDDLFDNDKEVTGIVEAIGDHSLTVDGIEYRVTSDTEYDGLDGLDDLSVGDEVSIEYKERGGMREALEIERHGEANGEDDFVVTYDPPFEPSTMQRDVTNPYFPLPPGAMWEYTSDTEDGTERIVVEVLDETREVAGVTTTVVRDRVYLDGALIEDTFDWYAQDQEGSVWYMGEDTKEYEDGEVVSTAGSWEAGVDGAEAGILMPASPSVGQAYYQEFYEDEAEDRARVIAVNESVTVPTGTYNDCIETEDTTPLEPDVLEHKYYCPQIGTVLEVEGGEDVRVELVQIVMPTQ